jgi:cytochrome P450
MAYDTSPTPGPDSLDDDVERRHEGLRALRQLGEVVDFPGGQSVLAALTYETVDAGLRRVDDFGGSAAADDLDEHDKIVAALDEPRHGKVRRIINSVVAFHKSQQIEPYLRDLTSRLIDEMLDEARQKGAEVDVVAHLAQPIPPAAMARLMGFPEEDSRLYYEWMGKGAAEIERAARENRSVAVTRLNSRLSDYIDARIAERVALPREEWPSDALTRFLIADVDGEPLDHRAIRTQVQFMIGAGTETTRSTMGNLLYRLARDPETYAALRADRSLIDSAVEEALRIDAPAQFMVRTCKRTTELGDRQISAGQKVFMHIGAANRDQERFEDPDCFRVGRERREHLAFGSGPHMCPGAALARLELRTALGCFADRIERFRLVSDHYDMIPSLMLQSPRTVKIAIEAEARF